MLIKMSSRIFITIIILSLVCTTMAKGGRLGRIENDIKSLDLKLKAYSLDILALQNDVADTNKKLDILLDIMNGTTAAHQVSSNIDTDSGNNDNYDNVEKLNDLQERVRGEINRVRRAFVTEKKKLSQQQKRNNNQFFEFAEMLNHTVEILNENLDTKWTLASKSMNESVVAVLGYVRDEIDNHLSVWNQSVHETLDANSNKTLVELDKLDQSIDSWNENVLNSLNNVDRNINSFINTSVIRHDNFITELQSEVNSFVTSLHKEVQSMDLKENFTNVINAIKSHENGAKVLLYELIKRGDTIRLVNSPSELQGRLEMFIDGQWGTVCDDSFNNTDATVACRMLGFRNGIYKDKAYFGQGTLPIVMDDINCKGTENSLQECPHVKNHNCDHSEDVGLICSY